MATRDLTRKFVDYRTTAKIIGRNAISPPGSYGMDSGLLEDASSGGWQQQRLQLPPVWVDLVDRVDGITAKISVRIKELEALHKKRLMVSFDDSEAAKERDIDYTTHEITALFREAEMVLKRLPEEGGSSDMESVVTRNIQKSMARRIQQMSMSFRKAQKEYMTRLKAQKEGNAVFDFLGVQDVEERKYRENGFTPEQLAILEDQEATVTERDHEIAAIAKSIEELSQIFKELAVLVIDQGTVLDRIDYNMEQVVERTKEGVQQLIKAETTQKSAGAVRCIVVLLILIAVMIIILILKHS